MQRCEGVSQTWRMYSFPYRTSLGVLVPLKLFLFKCKLNIYKQGILVKILYSFSSYGVIKQRKKLEKIKHNYKNRTFHNRRFNLMWAMIAFCCNKLAALRPRASPQIRLSVTAGVYCHTWWWFNSFTSFSGCKFFRKLYSYRMRDWQNFLQRVRW